ncbi:unnamed protein product [Brachionus calyciflorus]|uniref:SWIM-type domain-containing protein n=1 Tax=Brachionus calyciflorus TaxID=104777 RepID=A0A814GE50_9BILA|nr:unnamed protein product [Brachionus calyciflorus]
MTKNKQCNGFPMDCENEYCTFQINPVPIFKWMSERINESFSCTTSPKLITGNSPNDYLFNGNCKVSNRKCHLHDSIIVWDATIYHESPLYKTIVRQRHESFVASDSQLNYYNKDYLSNKIKEPQLSHNSRKEEEGEESGKNDKLDSDDEETSEDSEEEDDDYQLNQREQIPSQKKNFNFLDSYKKEIFGDARMAYLLLQNWCLQNSYEFLNENDAYVLDYKADIYELQLSFSESKFKPGYKLLKEKYTINEDISGGRLKIILYRWSTESNINPTIRYDSQKDIYFLSRESDPQFENFIDMIYCDEKCYLDCDNLAKLNFDGYISLLNSIRMVNSNWKFSSCSCKGYFKNYACKHILVIVLSKKISRVPDKYLDSVIESKPKPRKKKKSSILECETIILLGLL